MSRKEGLNDSSFLTLLTLLLALCTFLQRFLPSSVLQRASIGQGEYIPILNYFFLSSAFKGKYIMAF